MPTPAGPSSFAREFTRRTLFPIVGVIIAAFALATVLLYQLARQQDEASREQSTRSVAAALDASRQVLETTVNDYAAWGDAYRHLHANFDLSWAYDQQNLGETLYSRFGFEYVLVIAPDGETVYSVTEGALSDAAVKAPLEGGLDALIAQARRAGEDETEVVYGVLTAGGEPVLAAAGALSTGGDPTVAAVPGPASILVFADRLTPENLATMGEAMFVPGLRSAPAGTAQPGTASMALERVDGSQGPDLRWDPPTPGRAMIYAVVPWLVVAALGLAAFTGAVIRHGARAASLVEDATRRLAEAHEQATHLALHDPVTGLPNRTMLARALGERLSSPNRAFLVLFLDLDRFKPINDSLGHDAGDRVLREVAVRLRDAVAKHDLVARVGGDEFVIIRSPAGEAEIGTFCTRLIGSISAPIPYEGSEVFVGASIGISLAPDDADTPEELVRKADIALYQAKRDGRGTYRFFADEMNERILQRRRLELDLRRALERRELTLNYQPRVNAFSLQVVSCEALLRWHHPERGTVPPSVFIPLAEETGLIVPIGEWVLKTACAEAARWAAGIGVSVNVSPTQFRDPAFVHLVAETLRQTGLAADRLELEVTEGVLLENVDEARETMFSLRDMGVRLAIDDFGTGYSSIGYLRTFPFNTIKIDRQFIGGLGNTGDSRAIVRAIVGLGQALGMSVTAEGVETAAQLELLQAEHCEELQGYLIAMPLTDEGVSAFMSQRETEPVSKPRRDEERSIQADRPAILFPT